MSLVIAGGELRRMYAHVREGYPNEVVGILAGERATGKVSRVEPLINERADSARNRYQVSSMLLMRAEQRLEAQGLEIVGYYHSHPDHPSQYSDFDRDHALPNMSYAIVSCRDGEIADLLSWRLRDDRTAMDAEEVHIQEEALVKVHIHTALRPFTGGQAAVDVQAATVGEALEALVTAHPALKAHLRDDSGKIRGFINIFLGDDDIRYLQKEATPVVSGQDILLVPSIAGGHS